MKITYPNVDLVEDPCVSATQPYTSSGSRRLRSQIGLSYAVWAVGLALLGSTGSKIAQAPANDKPSLSSPQSLDETKDRIKQAGQLYKEEKFQASAEQLEICNRALMDLVLSSEKKDLPEWERVHRQLVKAAEALSIQGADLSPLPEWKEILEVIRQGKSGKTKTSGDTKPMLGSSDGPEISFSKEVAPILIEHCGRCHIDKSSGGFTMATYEQLAKGSKAGVVVFPGDPISSPLISAVESGQMPPNGNRVPEEKILKLKAWVTQGAKFDGSDSKATLNTLKDAGEPGAPAETPMVDIQPTTGKETVSFANDIAPILVANCNGCHYRGNNAPGGLRFNNFTELLRGGDSGSTLSPGDADNSLLLKKLLGTAGQRMPAGGRPPLGESQIALVRTWINEGATFDGDGRDSRLDTVIAKSWTARASHTELMERRMERARANWQIVAPKSSPDEANDGEFHIIGNIGKGASEKLLAQANQASKSLRRQLKLSGKDPLVKGGFTIFALKSRYDYSELGKMLEKRELPSEWSAHWRKETPDFYIAMVYDASEAKLNELSLLQQLTSAWIASHEGAPKWFAEGAGRNALANAVGANDARVQPWNQRFAGLMTELKSVQPILEGKMNEEDEAILGFGLIRRLQATQLRQKYELTLKQLASGNRFDEVFTKNLGPVDLFLKQSLGKP